MKKTDDKLSDVKRCEVPSDTLIPLYNFIVKRNNRPEFKWHDGGRYLELDRKTEVGDCATRAISIALHRPYKEVYDVINYFCKIKKRQYKNGKRIKSGSRMESANCGIFKKTFLKVIDFYRETGFIINWTPTKFVGEPTKVHFNSDELPRKGRFILNLSMHYTAYINGTVYDLYMDDRKGTRMVYGYWEIRNIPNQYDMHLKPRNEKRYTIQESCDLGDLLAKHK